MSTAFIVKLCNTPRHASHKTLNPFLGNCCHSCNIAVLNSSIFWHFGLRWVIFRPIKSHTCSIGFMYGDIAGHVIVWTAFSCKTCTIRALCGLALSFMNIGLSAHAWLSKRGTTRGGSTLSRYVWPVRLPSRTYKSNLQSKEKQPQTVTSPPHPQKQLCPQCGPEMKCFVGAKPLYDRR
jgi:hypothetical protein